MATVACRSQRPGSPGERLAGRGPPDVAEGTSVSRCSSTTLILDSPLSLILPSNSMCTQPYRYSTRAVATPWKPVILSWYTFPSTTGASVEPCVSRSARAAVLATERRRFECGQLPRGDHDVQVTDDL